MVTEDQPNESADPMRSPSEVALTRAQRRLRIGAGVAAGVVLLGIGGTAIALRLEPSSQTADAADTTTPEPTARDTTVRESTTTLRVSTLLRNEPMQLDATVTVVNRTTLRVAVSGKDEDAPMPNGQVHGFSGLCSPIEVVSGSEASLQGRTMVAGDPLLVARRFLDGTDATDSGFCGATKWVFPTPPFPAPISQCRPDCAPLDTSMDIVVPGPGVYTVRVSVISGLAGGSDNGVFRSVNTLTREATVPA